MVAERVGAWPRKTKIGVAVQADDVRAVPSGLAGTLAVRFSEVQVLFQQTSGRRVTFTR